MTFFCISLWAHFHSQGGASEPRTNSANSIIKFADDTDLIVGARQLETRTRELNNIKEWALRNNLCLNESKSVEMVFVNKKRKLAFETCTTLLE